MPKVRRQSLDAVYRASVSGTLRAGQGGRVSRRSSFFSRTSTISPRSRASCGATTSSKCLFNLPAGRFRSGRSGTGQRPAPNRGVSGRRARGARDRAAARVRAAELPRRAAPGRGARRDTGGDPGRQSALRGGGRRRRRVSLQVVEPLNAFDAPGYFLPTPDAGFALVERAAHPNLLLQYDIYHSQRMSGNLAATIAAADRADRSRADRRQPGPARAGDGRDQLSLRAAGAG